MNRLPIQAILAHWSSQQRKSKTAFMFKPKGKGKTIAQKKGKGKQVAWVSSEEEAESSGAGDSEDEMRKLDASAEEDPNNTGDEVDGGKSPQEQDRAQGGSKHIKSKPIPAKVADNQYTSITCFEN